METKNVSETNVEENNFSLMFPRLRLPFENGFSVCYVV